MCYVAYNVNSTVTTRAMFDTKPKVLRCRQRYAVDIPMYMYVVKLSIHICLTEIIRGSFRSSNMLEALQLRFLQQNVGSFCFFRMACAKFS